MSVSEMAQIKILKVKSFFGAKKEDWGTLAFGSMLPDVSVEL